MGRCTRSFLFFQTLPHLQFPSGVSFLSVSFLSFLRGCGPWSHWWRITRWRKGDVRVVLPLPLRFWGISSFCRMLTSPSTASANQGKLCPRLAPPPPWPLGCGHTLFSPSSIPAPSRHLGMPPELREGSLLYLLLIQSSCKN